MRILFVVGEEIYNLKDIQERYEEKTKVRTCMLYDVEDWESKGIQKFKGESISASCDKEFYMVTYYWCLQMKYNLSNMLKWREFANSYF